jgi:putative transposase
MQRHRGEDVAILERRELTYQKARAKNPMRWGGGIRNWTRQIEVVLNPAAGETLKMDVAC